MFTLGELDDASRLVHAVVPPTPQRAWPLLSAEAGLDLVVKHENHLPTGAFKVRGGLVAMDRLRRDRPNVAGIISATRGNHGQSLAFAGVRAGLAVTIVVPHGNSREKNAAMRAYGAELIEHGQDFDDARDEALRLAAERGLVFQPSYAPELCVGVATYALEFFRAVTDADVVYVPVGLGSGITGVIRTRDLLGLRTEVVGVIAAASPTYALSLAAGRPVPTNRADTFADGITVRVADAGAVGVIAAGAARLVQVGDDAIAEAVRLLFRTTHNAAEGAGAAALAGALQERERLAGKRVGVILTGGNIDTAAFAAVLSGRTPATAQG